MRRSLILLLLGLACRAGWPQPLAAQFSDDARTMLAESVFLPAPRDLRQRLKYAREALDAGRYTEASAMLGNLVAGRLEEIENEDYFIVSEEQPGTLLSLKSEAENMIGTMPAAGREAYELQFGAEARQMLAQALRTGDTRQLAEVTRLFFHTRAGYEAALILGRYHLDRGRPLAAALGLERLARYPAALADYDPDASLLLATCWYLANMPQRARDTLVDLRRRRPRAEFDLPGGGAAWAPGQADPLAWLAERLGSQPSFADSLAQSWAMHRGGPGRNARSSGGAPLYHPRWVSMLHNEVKEEQLVDKILEEDFVAKGIAPLPAAQPLAVGDTVMVRTPERLQGIDLITGKIVWTFPYWNDLNELSASGHPEGLGAAQRRVQLSQRLFHDFPYGQISSDGKSVFMIDELGFAAVAQRSQIVGRGGAVIANPNWPSNHNQLIALDVEREGTLKWVVGGESGEDEPRLQGAFFLGPPLPLMGQLYALAEFNGDIIRLVVLDADTGRLQWSQQVAQVEGRRVGTDLTRRLAGASPSFADGVLVCPTSAGAVVAVDIVTRTLLWGFTYQSEAEPFDNRWRMQQAAAEVSDDGWADSTVTVADGKVLITPRESEEFHCLDLPTGKPLWPAQDRRDLVYNACIHDGKAIMVGTNRVTAVLLDDGAPAWEQDVDLGSALPSGRGFYAGNYYYLPTTAAELLEIDLENGEVVRTFETERTLGNLICYRDQIVSLVPTRLESYHQAEPLREWVAARLEQNPDDPEALAHRAELKLQDGDRQAALESLRQAWEIEPDDFRVKRLLAKTALVALRADFEKYHETVQDLEPVLTAPRQHAEYLRLMAEGWQRMGKTQQAFDTYLKLAVDADAPLQAMEEVGPKHAVRRDRWLQARLAELLADADPQRAGRLQAAVEAHLESAKAEGTVAALRRADALFGFHPSARPLQLLLAERLLEAREYLQAELLLTHLQTSPEQAVAGKAAALLAALLEENDKLAAAARQYRLAADRFGETPIRGDQTAAALLEQFLQRHAGTPLIGAAAVWPNGKAESTLESTRSHHRPSYQRIYPIALRRVAGATPIGLNVTLDQQRNDVVISDGWGRVVQRGSVNRGDGRRFYLSNYNVTYSEALGHLTLVSIGSEVLAIDALAELQDDDSPESSPVLWRRDAVHSAAMRNGRAATNVRLQSRSIDNPWGPPRVVATDDDGQRVGIAGPLTRRGVCVQRSLEVACVDPLNGREIWVRRDVEPGSELFGDEELLFIVPPGAETATVVSMTDGSLLGERMIPAEADRWATQGSRLLCWMKPETSPAGHTRVFLLDPWTGNVVWSRQYEPGTRGEVIADDELVMLTNEGALEILDVATGELKVNERVEIEEPLTAVHVLRSSDEWIVAAGLLRNREDSNDVNLQPAPSGLYAPLVDGKIWCVERESGQLRWQAAADVNRYGLPLDQSTETPILTLMRKVTSVERNGTRRARTAVLLLDKRDGRAVFAHDGIGTQTYTYGLYGEPEKDRVVLELPGFEVRVDYSEAPRPPQIPVQSDLLSLDSQQASGPVAGVAEHAPQPFANPFPAAADPFQEANPFRQPEQRAEVPAAVAPLVRPPQPPAAAGDRP